MMWVQYKKEFHDVVRLKQRTVQHKVDYFGCIFQSVSYLPEG